MFFSLYVKQSTSSSRGTFFRAVHTVSHCTDTEAEGIRGKVGPGCAIVILNTLRLPRVQINGIIRIDVIDVISSWEIVGDVDVDREVIDVDKGVREGNFLSFADHKRVWHNGRLYTCRCCWRKESDS